MLLTDDEINVRLESPLNLLNRLRKETQTSHNRAEIPALPPKIDNLVDDLEDKLKYTTIKNKAANILTTCLTELETRVREIHKPEKLSVIAKDMNMIIEAQKKQNYNDTETGPQILIYAPRIKDEREFTIIQARE